MKKRYDINFNYLIADIVSQFNLGILRRARVIKIAKTKMAIRILKILYIYGLIRTFRIKADRIFIYFKYFHSQPICKLSIVSRPGRRCYWSLNRFSLVYNSKSFAGFYIISTQQGLVTSDMALLKGNLSGEILIKVEI